MSTNIQHAASEKGMGRCCWIAILLLLLALIVLWLMGYGPTNTACCTKAPDKIESASTEPSSPVIISETDQFIVFETAETEKQEVSIAPSLEQESIQNDPCVTLQQNPQDVLFPLRGAILNQEAKQQLTELAPCLVGKKINITIDGYTDLRGNPEFNQLLSQERADAVSSWLTKEGVDVTQITSIGQGATDEFGVNDPNANRKAVIRIK